MKGHKFDWRKKRMLPMYRNLRLGHRPSHWWTKRGNLRFYRYHAKRKPHLGGWVRC